METRTIDMPARTRFAKVTHFCPNPRLVGIQFEDGAKERASMWLGWRNPRINERVEVVLERGFEGVNGIYEEVATRI